ncbi:MAG TPA: hypothetical protein VJV78_33215 [Polyangiales bacterium]|nr:hypothetical protein [Polyangiales bacterium]
MSLPRMFAVPRALRDPWLAASWAGLVIVCALIAAFGQDAGVTWDEGFQLQYGQRVLAWFRSGFQDRGALEYLDLYLYGGLFDAPAQWIVEHSSLGPFETRHVLTAIVALLGMYGTWLIAAAVGGTRAGFFGAATLALTPAWIGHGLFNPKDVPFATATVFVTWAAQRIALGEGPLRAREVLIAGLTVGAALGVRPGGYFLISYPILAAIVRELRASTDTGQHAISRAARALPLLGLLLGTAWLVMLSAWPWAQLDPVARPVEAMYAASHFNWPNEMLFEGRQVLSTELPARYLLVWFGITSPEIYFIAAAAGVAMLVFAIRARSWNSVRGVGCGFIAWSAAFPLMAALVTRPTLYDAHRHFLFLFPPLAALGGIAIADFTRDARIWSSVRASVLGAWSVAALLVAVEIVELHPYEYVYFNRLAGGLPGASGRYETDYWGASYREGLEWVVAHVHQQRPLRIAACDSSAAGRLHYYLQRWPGAARRFSIVESPGDADLFLAVTRFNCHRRVAAEALHSIERQGVPLLYVLHPTRTTDAVRSAL